MTDFRLLSEEEKTEIYSQVSEMAEEGIPPKEIADELELSVDQVKSICDDLGVEYKRRPLKIRALTQAEFKDFKKSRKRGETLASLSNRLGINKNFLSKMDVRVRFVKTCRDCHTSIRKSLTYCADCRKRRQNDRVMNRQAKRYKEDPEFRAKWIEDVKKLQSKKKA